MLVNGKWYVKFDIKEAKLGYLMIIKWVKIEISNILKEKL